MWKLHLRVQTMPGVVTACVEPSVRGESVPSAFLVIFCDTVTGRMRSPSISREIIAAIGEQVRQARVEQAFDDNAAVACRRDNPAAGRRDQLVQRIEALAPLLDGVDRRFQNLGLLEKAH
jgi:hypothetical protein